MKISIVTATYNSASTLFDTLKSILCQSYTDYEVILIDGGSTDGTLKVVDYFRSELGSRLVLVSESDRGLYDAMNKGIRMATGDVVGILNSDDFYTSPDILALVARELADPEIDAVYGDIHYVNPNRLDRPVRYYSSKSFRRSWMRFGFMPAHPSFYCRRQVYLDYGLFDLQFRVAADFEQLLRLIYVHRIRTRYIEKDFVTMRTGGISNSGLRSHRLIMADHLRALRTHHIRSNFFLLSLRYFYKAVEILKRGRK